MIISYIVSLKEIVGMSVSHCCPLFDLNHTSAATACRRKRLVRHACRCRIRLTIHD